MEKEGMQRMKNKINSKSISFIDPALFCSTYTQHECPNVANQKHQKLEVLERKIDISHSPLYGFVLTHIRENFYSEN